MSSQSVAGSNGAKQGGAFEGKWALVTGSSRGIGQQIALGLAREGCSIVVHGRNAESTKKTLALLAPLGVKTAAVHGELSDLAIARKIAQEAVALSGGIDILYNNAAIMHPWKDSCHDIPMSDWQLSFTVNLFAMIEICNQIVPLMRKKGWGRVINVSSGIKDQPQLSGYSVTKAAVDKYTADLGWELKGTGVVASMLDPGWLKTDLGGPNADHEVETVLPGALVPARLADDAPQGVFFRAQEHRG